MAMLKRRPGDDTPPPVPTPAKKSTRKPPKKPRKTPHRQQNRDRGYKYDWLEVRTAFIEGIQEEGQEEKTFMNMVEIAERFNIPVQRVRERGADERWYEQRNEYQLRMAKARQTKRILELSGESVDFDSKSLNVAKLGMAMVTARMSEIARDVKDQQRRREDAINQQMQGLPVDPEDLETVIDAKELNTLAQSAVMWQQLGQKALGTDIQRMEIQQDIQQNIDVDVQVTSISAELGRDDPERLAGFLQAAKRAGLLEQITEAEELDATEQGMLGIEAAETDIVEAELVDD
jgi:hypothetical protein